MVHDSSQYALNDAKKKELIKNILELGKKALAANGGKDIPLTCVDGRGPAWLPPKANKKGEKE